MDAAAIAERQETDGLAWQAQRDLPGLSFPAGWRVDQEDQSDSVRVGEILCHRPLESVFLIHPILGRKEDPAPSGPSVPASRMRLEAVGQGMAVWNTRTLLGVSGFLWAVDLGSRSGLIGLITLDVNCAGARSAGNPLATCDVAGAGNQLTVRIVRHLTGQSSKPNHASHRREALFSSSWDFLGRRVALRRSQILARSPAVQHPHWYDSVYPSFARAVQPRKGLGRSGCGTHPAPMPDLFAGFHHRSWSPPQTGS